MRYNWFEDPDVHATIRGNHARIMTAKIDPDDAPTLTKEWFDRATVHSNGKPISERIRLRDDPQERAILDYLEGGKR